MPAQCQLPRFPVAGRGFSREFSEAPAFKAGQLDNFFLSQMPKAGLSTGSVEPKRSAARTARSQLLYCSTWVKEGKD